AGSAPRRGGGGGGGARGEWGEAGGGAAGGGAAARRAGAGAACSVRLGRARCLFSELVAALPQLAFEMPARQVSGDARQHFFALDRLGDVVDRAELEPPHLFRDFAARAQEKSEEVETVQ